MKNVLVFPCGSEIGLEINRALVHSTYFTVYGGSSEDDHGRFVYKNYIGDIPHVDKPEFIPELNKIIEEFQIDFIIPAHDSVVLKLAENQSIIKADIITSPAETCRICRSKKRTYELFEKLLPTPHIYTTNDSLNFPVFLKPDVGQGSKGTQKVTSEEEVALYVKKDPSLLILEYLPGKEYTIDCFTNKEGKLLFAEGRIRNRIYNGISVNSSHITNVRFQQLAEIINDTLSLRGCWFFQVKESMDGELVLMEIAPRIPGTGALFRATGINIALLSLFDRSGYKVGVIQNNFKAEIDRALFGRFSLNIEYDYVYVDFDDTIIVNSLVNTTLLKFLYQAKNNSKKIILITKHKFNIKETLDKYAISHLLFDDIISLEQLAQKSDYMKYPNSIFIDDSFAERSAILEKLQIPVFGLDAIEALLDWRE